MLALLLLCSFSTKSSASHRLLSTISPTYTWSSVYNALNNACRFPQYNEFALDEPKAWCPVHTNNPGDWLQVDLGAEYLIDSVSTWSRGPSLSVQQWVISYNLSYSIDGNLPFISLGTFEANSQMNTEKKHHLYPTIKARYLRFIPVEYNGYKSMRVEMSGSPITCFNDLTPEIITWFNGNSFDLNTNVWYDKVNGNPNATIVTTDIGLFYGNISDEKYL